MLKSFVLAAALAGVLPAAVAQTAFTVNGQFVSVEEQKQLMDFLRANGVTNEKQLKNAARSILLEQKIIEQAARNEGLLEDGKRRGTPSAHTVQAYVNALLEAYFFYDIKRFDIKGKEFLRTLGKYYIVDIGLRNYLLGFRDRDSGHAIENVVYFELLRRDYDVSIGKVDNSEVDFIATKVDDKLYVQVTESMYINTPVPVARKKLSNIRCID